MSRISRQESVRPTRVPVSSSRAPLVVKNFDHDNFAGRWVNDVDDRIADFLAGGYEFVHENEKLVAGEKTVDSSSKGLDTRVKKAVGRGVTAYLMKIPIKWYKEDQANKMREVNETERAITTPGRGAVQEGVDYGQVSIGNKKGREVIDYKDIES
jgi:hypothetical protein